jgi:L-threonylcarbamoyladenylate synthase
LTLVLRRASGVGDYLTGGQESVGLRIPGHPVALELLREFGGGVAAPSANRFGRISPTCAEHVRRDLGADVDLILDGGACEIGIESTIVDVSRGKPVVLRPGRISEADIARALGFPPAARDAGAPRAPGTLQSHYAPRRPLRLVASREWDLRLRGQSKGRGVMALRARPAGDPSVIWIEAPADPRRYGHDLYANLRTLDSSNCDEILVEEPPASAEWTAVRDRLSRARSE